MICVFQYERNWFIVVVMGGMGSDQSTRCGGGAITRTVVVSNCYCLLEGFDDAGLCWGCLVVFVVGGLCRGRLG